MIDNDKPYNKADDVFCYYMGLMIIEFPKDEQSNFHLLNDCLTEASGKLEFFKGSLSRNVWQVRCKADHANEANKILQEFIGQCLQNNNIKNINLTCQFSLEWLNYADIGCRVDNPIDDYIIGNDPYTINNLFHNNPLFLRWLMPDWTIIS